MMSHVSTPSPKTFPCDTLLQLQLERKKKISSLIHRQTKGDVKIWPKYKYIYFCTHSDGRCRWGGGVSFRVQKANISIKQRGVTRDTSEERTRA